MAEIIKEEKEVKPKAVKKIAVVKEVKEEKVVAPKVVEAQEVKEEVVVVAKKPTKTAKVKGDGTTRATGRRKEAIARVRAKIGGSGKVVVNGKPLEEYFVSGFNRIIVNQPIKLLDIKSYDFIVSVHGGGLTGQAGAIRHGIARALVKEDAQYKVELKKAGFLKRDPRMKERKKYGLKKARRAPQFSKR